MFFFANHSFVKIVNVRIILFINFFLITKFLDQLGAKNRFKCNKKKNLRFGSPKSVSFMFQKEKYLRIRNCKNDRLRK